MAVAIFFVSHWMLSVFCQTFFLHRHASHRMFTMRPGWQRFFHLLTYLSQGSSYLEPHAYAVLHRQHHAYSDTPRDPHSPRNFGNVFSMMWATKKRYDAYAFGHEQPPPRFAGGTPEWPLLDRIGSSWTSRLTWCGLYTLFYVQFATAAWMFVLLPIHFVMGPLHGAIVNWCGHRYGYRNFDSDDDSRNTLVFDFLTLGELFQNNHHRFPMSTNFACRRVEIDPCHQVMRVLARLNIIDFGPHPQQMRVAATAAHPEEADRPEDRSA